MKRIRFFIASTMLEVALYIMPFEAEASFFYNTRFLTKND